MVRRADTDNGVFADNKKLGPFGVAVVLDENADALQLRDEMGKEGSDMCVFKRARLEEFLERVG